MSEKLSKVCADLTYKTKNLAAFVLLDKVSLGEMRYIVGYLTKDGKNKFTLGVDALPDEEVIENSGTSKARITGKDICWKDVISKIDFSTIEKPNFVENSCLSDTVSNLGVEGKWYRI